MPIKIGEILRDDFEYILNSDINWKAFNNSNILITGATGLIGSLLVKFFDYLNKVKKINISISILVRDKDKAAKIFEACQVNIIEQDIRDPLKTKINFDYIIHCAAITKSKKIVSNPIENLEVSIKGTENILKTGKDSKVKSMVYLSSMEVYGEIRESTRKISEKDLGWLDLTNPRSSYPEGKRISELLCNSYYFEHNIPVKIARLAQTFGPGVSIDETRVFAQFAKSLINNENIVLHTEGKTTGNYCYTADSIKGILYLLLKGENGQAYNIVNEENTMTIKEMAELVVRDLANNKISIIYDIPENSLTYGYAARSNMMLSASKISELGWKPKFTMADMYRRMIENWGK